VVSSAHFAQLAPRSARGNGSNDPGPAFLIRRTSLNDSNIAISWRDHQCSNPRVEGAMSENPKDNDNVIPLPDTAGTGSKYASRSEFGAGAAVRALTPVKLGKSKTFMRANLALAEIVTVVDAAKADAMNKDLYPVLPEAVAAGALAGITTDYDALLVPLVDRDGIAFLWDIRRLNRDGVQMSSYDAAMTVLEGTIDKPGIKDVWGRVEWKGNGYILDYPPRPEVMGEPRWPSNLVTFDQWVEAAFAGKVINDCEHKILRHLRGEI
jgi:hypothetical protein